MTAQTFTATVEPTGNATGVTVPDDIVDELGGGRPLVVISINGHSWRSRIAAKSGRSLIGISRANRTAAGIELGQDLDTTLELDTEPRTVDVPNDVAEAFDTDPSIRAAFDALPYGLRRKHINDIDAAKTGATRQRPHRQAGHDAQLNPRTTRSPGRVGFRDRTPVRVGGATLTQSTRAPWSTELVVA